MFLKFILNIKNSLFFLIQKCLTQFTHILKYIPQSISAIQVAPTLPVVTVTTSLPPAAHFLSSADEATIVTSAMTTLYCGQT